MKLFTCHLDELSDRLKNKIVICFGAGRNMDGFLNWWPQSNFLERISYFWDNDKNKWGSVKELAGKAYPIYKPGYFPTADYENYAIVITTIYYKEILLELNEMQNCREIACYVMEFARCRYRDGFHWDQDEIEVDGDDSSCRSKTDKIPKKIHYCWFGKKEMPDGLKKNIETWHRFCPDYEIIRWDEDNYDITKNNYMKKAYEAKRWGFVPDYARLDIVNSHGGIYLDTDVELLRNLDDLLLYKCFCGFQSDGLVNLGQGFGAQKGMKIIREMMRQYDNLEFMESEDSTKIIPSPVYQTEVLQRNGMKKKNRFQAIEEMAVFPREFFCPKSVYHGLTEITPDTYTIHHFAASWFEDGLALYEKEYMDVLYETRQGEVYRYEERDEKGCRSLIFG